MIDIERSMLLAVARAFTLGSRAQKRITFGRWASSQSARFDSLSTGDFLRSWSGRADCVNV
jgi:hypothetical protein